MTPNPRRNGNDEAEYKHWLKTEGCTNCGEDNPELLDAYVPQLPECPQVQSAVNGRGEVWCDDCKDERPTTFTESMLRRARDINDRNRDRNRGRRVAAVLVYGCGQVAFDRVTRISDPVGSPWPDEREEYVPSGPVECPGCGAGIEHAVRRSFRGGGDE